MASKTLLLDLPNELFPFIFQYLRSIDILKAFSNIQCRRLQALIQSFIKELDISQESDECIQSYLPDLFLHDGIIALRIQMKHLTIILEYLSSPTIQSIEVINWDFDFDFSNEVVRQLRQNLTKLSLTFTELGEIACQDVQLFQSDSQLEHLTIKNCVLYYHDADLEICTHLTYLSVELEGMHPLFMFMQHLPNLQKLKVKIVSQECFSQTAPDINGVKPCKTLRAVTFTGWIKCFDHLETFFATFGSTIEYLFLDIYLMFFTVDGTRLERNLLDKMPRLSSLNLNIFSTFGDEDPIQIETFQSFTWKKLNPVVYWYDIHAQQHTLFTLPYKWDRFKHFSNDFVSTCVSNRPISLCFERVRTLSLINTTPLNLETFLLIQKAFPNVTTIELREKDTHPLAEDDEDEEERSVGVLSMNEDLLLDTGLQILSVTKFVVDVSSERIDYKSFYRFLRLLPNLVDLELELGHPLLHYLLKHKNEDDFTETALARINQLKIIYWHESDTLTDADIHCLFPKIKSVVKPRDDEYSGD